MAYAVPTTSLEARMQAYDAERLAALAQTGQMPEARDVLSPDNTHRIDYEVSDPFGGWRKPTSVGAATMELAETSRPRVGEVLARATDVARRMFSFIVRPID